jgi:hypothetical protein
MPEGTGLGKDGVCRMELNDKVTQLEDEIKILKNEVQAVLFDLREVYLNNTNPFNSENNVSVQPVIVPSPPPVPQITPPVVAQTTPDIIEEQTSKPEEIKKEPELKTPEPKKPENKKTAIESQTHSKKEEIPEDPPEDELPENELPDIEEPVIFRQKMRKTNREERDFLPQVQIKEWRPRTDKIPSVNSGKSSEGKDGKVALESLSKLALWVEATVKEIGVSKTEGILEVSAMMGYLSPDMKSILLKFINPASGPQPEKATAREYLSSLMALTDLLGKDNKVETALLYILCQERDKSKAG